MTAKYFQPVSECITFHENVDNTVNLITSTFHHLCSHYTSQLDIHSMKHKAAVLKAEIQLALCLIKQYTMKGDDGQKVQFHIFLTLVGPTSSYLRQCILLYLVRCQAQIDSLFCKLFTLSTLISYHLVAKLLTLRSRNFLEN
jgi:hypothetical protein